MTESPKPIGRNLQRGDFVTIVQDSDRLRAMVALASPDGVSIMLMYDGVIRTKSGGGLVRMAPLLRQDDGSYIEIVEETPIALEMEDTRTDA